MLNLYLADRFPVFSWAFVPGEEFSGKRVILQRYQGGYNRLVFVRNISATSSSA